MNEPKLMCVKRTTIYGILLLMALTMQAQTSAKVKERVAEIRKLYADAKENMVYNDQDGYPAKTNMEVTYYYMAPGAGPIKHNIMYYVSDEEDDVGMLTGFKTYFVSDSYNSGARKIYENISLIWKRASWLSLMPMRRMAMTPRMNCVTTFTRTENWLIRT